jgi:dephospho-CoA kinase
MDGELRILVIIGKFGAGKDEIANYLKDVHGVPSLAIGEFARNAVTLAEGDIHLKPDETLSGLAETGPEYVIAEIIDTLAALQWPLRVITLTGVVDPAEIRALKENFGSSLTLVVVDGGEARNRYARIKARGLPSDPGDFDAFLEIDRQIAGRLNLAETRPLADIVLDNSNTREQFYRQIEQHVVPVFSED